MPAASATSEPVTGIALRDTHEAVRPPVPLPRPLSRIAAAAPFDLSAPLRLRTLADVVRRGGAATVAQHAWTRWSVSQAPT